MMMLENDDDAGLPHPVSRHGDDPGVSIPVLPCQRPGDDMCIDDVNIYDDDGNDDNDNDYDDDNKDDDNDDNDNNYNDDENDEQEAVMTVDAERLQEGVVQGVVRRSRINIMVNQ